MSGRRSRHPDSTDSVSAVSHVTPSAKSNTGQLNRTSTAPGRSAAPMSAADRTAADAIATPTTPPHIDTISDSATSGRMMAVPVAPSAARTASSRRRADTRASSTFARFAQATTSSSPTDTINRSSTGRTRPTSSSCSGSTAASDINVSWPYRCLSRFATVVASARAVARLTPSRRRATTSQL